jgi:hypothetical protein
LKILQNEYDRERENEEKKDSAMTQETEVKRALVSLMIPTDLLIRSELEVKSTSQLPRNITTVALKEGIPIYE